MVYILEQHKLSDMSDMITSPAVECLFMNVSVDKQKSGSTMGSPLTPKRLQHNKLDDLQDLSERQN